MEYFLKEGRTDELFYAVYHAPWITQRYKKDSFVGACPGNRLKFGFSMATIGDPLFEDRLEALFVTFPTIHRTEKSRKN